MRVVIDSNQLQNPQLKKFLDTSKTNRAILTDYAAIEAYQGNTLLSILNSMSILGNYPNQVIILKNTQSICQLSGRAAGLQRRLIDDSQTSGFAEYIRKLNKAKSGYEPLVNEIVQHGKAAAQQLNRMLTDSAVMGQAFDDLGKDFTKDERRRIREDEPYTNNMIDKLVSAVMMISEEIFRTHPKAPHKVTYEQLPNTFIFRNSLCCYLLALEWSAQGGAKNAQHSKIRNDMIDSHFVTYATFFDGLLSDDAKAIRLHKKARYILAVAFGRMHP